MEHFTHQSVSRFSICQAYAQLESDYNRGGILIERPSNKRRNESTSCQLARLGHSDPFEHVEICSTDSYKGGDHDEVRGIYLHNVLTWGLPIDAEMMAYIKQYFVPRFWQQFSQCAGVDYLQGH